MRKRLTSREPIWSITRINREQSPFPDDNNVHPEFGKKWAVKATRPTTGTRAKYLDYLCAEKSNKFQTTTTTSTGNDGESESESENGRHLRALFCFALTNVRMRTIDTAHRTVQSLYTARHARLRATTIRIWIRQEEPTSSSRHRITIMVTLGQPRVRYSHRKGRGSSYSASRQQSSRGLS